MAARIVACINTLNLLLLNLSIHFSGVGSEGGGRGQEASKRDVIRVTFVAVLWVIYVLFCFAATLLFFLVGYLRFCYCLLPSNAAVCLLLAPALAAGI